MLFASLYYILTNFGFSFLWIVGPEWQTKCWLWNFFSGEIRTSKERIPTQAEGRLNSVSHKISACSTMIKNKNSYHIYIYNSCQCQSIICICSRIWSIKISKGTFSKNTDHVIPQNHILKLYSTGFLRWLHCDLR